MHTCISCEIHLCEFSYLQQGQMKYFGLIKLVIPIDLVNFKCIGKKDLLSSPQICTEFPIVILKYFSWGKWKDLKTLLCFILMFYSSENLGSGELCQHYCSTRLCAEPCFLLYCFSVIG